MIGHKVSAECMQVNKAKIEVIEKLPSPTNVKSIRSFLELRILQTVYKDVF